MKEVLQESNKNISSYDKLIVTLYKCLKNSYGFDDFFLEFQQVFNCQCGGIFAISVEPLSFLFSWSFGYPVGFEQWFVENDMIKTDEGLKRYMSGEKNKFQSYVAGSGEETFLPLVSAQTGAWAKQMGIVDSAGVLIGDNENFKLVFLINRHKSVGPFSHEDVDKLDTIAAHLEQVFQLYLTLYQSKQNAFAQHSALDLTNRPMAVINLMVEVEYVNQSAKQFLAQKGISGIAQGCRLNLYNKEQQKNINDLLLTVGSFARQNNPQSQSVLLRINAHKILFKVSPSMSENGKLINLIIEFFELSDNLILPLDLIIATLECTTGEAIIAKLLSEGLTVKEIASTQEISETDLKTSIKNILIKNNLNNQVDMISILVRLAF
ncbi:MAG: hypothetical protein HRU38_23095 [Saccharospirillaceae bacterium]|nr:LuxR C-terminal-related transcriptional regulator [Pseudomonadales bacterium]NRB81510.1 hypothetical protein [Saccharospirillaceae bacterium]